MAAHDNDHNVAAPVGRDKMDTTVFTTVKETRIYIVFPFFHVGDFESLLTVEANAILSSEGGYSS